MRILETLGMKLAVPARTVTLTAEDATPMADKAAIPPKDSVGPT
jgi:hypothetical protein